MEGSANWNMPDSYGDQTSGVIDALKAEDLKIEQNQGNVVLHLGRARREIRLTRFTRVTSQIVDGALRPSETKKKLAARISTSAGNFSAGRNARRMSRSVMMVLIFSQNSLPTVKQADHLLMQMGHPGLFVTTFSRSANRRNWILRNILEYGQDHPCPAGSWLEFANLALDWLGMEALNNAPRRGMCSGEVLQLLQAWDARRPAHPVKTYTDVRREYLQRYRKKNDLLGHGGKVRALEALQQQADQVFLPPQSDAQDPFALEHITDEQVRNMFGRDTNENSHVSRKVLICVAIALGCTLREANGMLFDSNQALLYPNQSDLQELHWVRLLCRNEEGAGRDLSENRHRNG